MAESTVKSEINLLEILMQIKEDVSSVKSNMEHFKETQLIEKENVNKAIADVREDFTRELKNLETTVCSRINSLQSVQNALVGDVETLKKSDDAKDAQKWRRVTTYLITAFAGIFIAKIPDLIKLLYIIFNTK